MHTTPDQQLKYLGMENLGEHWKRYCKNATAKKWSYHTFLKQIIADEYQARFEKRRLARIKAAGMPEVLVMETFPFNRQPRLKKKMVMELYDSLRFMQESQFLVFIGPTGCGKTGLATSYLVHAVNNLYRGRFVDFRQFLGKMRSAIADHSDNRLLKRFASIDCLLLDEVGYSPLDNEQAGFFFELIKLRHKKRTTIITSQLGFSEWNAFIKDQHLNAAILDRITENCTIFNMTDCISIRNKHIVYATAKESAR